MHRLVFHTDARQVAIPEVIRNLNRREAVHHGVRCLHRRADVNLLPVLAGNEHRVRRQIIHNAGRDGRVRPAGGVQQPQMGQREESADADQTHNQQDNQHPQRHPEALAARAVGFHFVHARRGGWNRVLLQHGNERVVSTGVLPDFRLGDDVVRHRRALRRRIAFVFVPDHADAPNVRIHQ